MFSIIARSLAVYGGSAALFLFLAHRFVVPIRLRMALVLAAAPLLFTGKATFTGGVYAPIDIVYQAQPFSALCEREGISAPRTPLLSDVVFSMIPWQNAIREAVENGRLPLWNRFVLGGEPLLAVVQPATLHPGTWLGFLLPLAQAWTFQMTLRLLIALLSAYLFFRDLWCSEIAALLGALAWAFSDFMMFWLGYPVAPSVGPFPLLLLGLSRLVQRGDRPAVGLTVVALVLMITAGHPETLLFGVTGAGIYFLFRLGSAGRGHRLRPLLLSLLAGALALGLCAVILLPFAEALHATWEEGMRLAWYAHVKKSISLAKSLRQMGTSVLPYAHGVSGMGLTPPIDGLPAGYAGSLLLPFVAAGLFSRNRQKWCFLVLAVFGLFLAAHLAGITDALSALPLFQIGVSDYFIFLVPFGVAALAALGAQRLSDGEGTPAFVAGAVLSAAGIGLLRWRGDALLRALEMPRGYLLGRLLLQIVPLLAGLGIVLALPRARCARAGVAALVLLFVAERMLEAGRVYPTAPSRAFYPPVAVLEKIPRGQPDRFAATQYAFIPNVAALYELEDIRGYESMTLKRLVETFPLWCKPQPVWFNRIDDPTRPFLSFLNVRWVVTPVGVAPPAGWPVLGEGDGVRLLENPRVLPRAFVPRFYRVEGDIVRRLELLASIDDFADRGVIEAGETNGAWVENGAARVTIAAYRPQSMDLDVEAFEPTLVATSVPGWPGWKARLDAMPVAAIPYNHAFLAYRVPPGRHRLTLSYFPDSFRGGLAVSAVSLALSLALLLWPRRPELRQNPV